MVKKVTSSGGAVSAQIINRSDYYPFGMPMPNREITDTSYRYKFQGQEKDTETGMEAFELRLWDGRLGRWQSPDPYGEFDSPYLGMGNNPIGLTDPDGGSTEGSDNKYKGVWNKETNKYDYTYVDNTGGEFYDVVNYEGGELNGVTDVIVNPLIKVQDNWFSDDEYFLEATSKRVGIGEWKYYSEAITPGHFEELLPIPYLKTGGKLVNQGFKQIGKSIGFSFLKDVGHKSLYEGIIKEVGMDLGKKYLSGFLIKNRFIAFRFQAHKHTLSTLSGVSPKVKVPHLNFNKTHYLLGKYRNNGSRWFKETN